MQLIHKDLSSLHLFQSYSRYYHRLSYTALPIRDGASAWALTWGDAVSLLFRTANVEGPYWGEYPGAQASDVIPHRMSMQLAPGHMINNDSALRHSAVWACLRLRANLISTFPIDVYRKGQFGIADVEVGKPPIIVNPGGNEVDYMEWMYSTQFDIDRAGNSIGLITERNGYGLPAVIELVPLAWTSVNIVDNKLVEYYIRGKPFAPCHIWHEKQYTVAGFHLGLSPIMFAAWSISEHLSIQDFAISWFTNGGIPRSHLQNTVQATITDAQAQGVKSLVKETVHSGDVLVTGKDWTYQMIQAEQTGLEWMEARKYGPSDIARFFDVPSDLIDSSVSGSAVTYANITQRNLQFLIMSLGPAILRRENALNKLLPNRQFVKMNTKSLLRMDPQTQAQIINLQVAGRVLAPSEARLLDDLPPLTKEQMAEFDRFWPPRQNAPTSTPEGQPPMPTPPGL
jgi:HK97 family phage portal protein